MLNYLSSIFLLLTLKKNVNFELPGRTVRWQQIALLVLLLFILYLLFLLYNIIIMTNKTYDEYEYVREYEFFLSLGELSIYYL